MGESTIAVPAILAIDLGTSGPKVAVVDVAGRALAWRSAPVATVHLPDGGAEQDAEAMWGAVAGASRAALAAAGPCQIIGVAVTSQYMSAVPVDANGLPTGPCVMWLDQRGAAHNLTLLTDEAFTVFSERHGLIPLPSGADNVAHTHVLRTHHPQAYDAAAAIVEPMDYLTARITGRVTATQSTSYSSLCCDNRALGATAHDPLLLAASAMDPGKLAPLVPMHGPIGEVRRDAADDLGIPTGVPVFPGTIDSITSAVGCAALDPSAAAVIIGTTAVLVSHVPRFAPDLFSGILDVPSPVPGMYYVMAENGIGGRALEWATQLFGYGGDDPISAALADAATSPVGSRGVSFFPWLVGSMAPSPNDDVRAALVGLGLNHGRADAVRAVVEGVAVNLAWLLPSVEAHTASTFSALRFGGGGAQSTLWAQALADASQRPVHRLAEPRATNARGAAFLALADLGRITLDDVAELVVTETVHEPEPANAATMAALLERAVTLHPALATIGAVPSPGAE